jgi:hypothetical protein
MNSEQYTTGDILEAMKAADLIGTVYDFRQFLNHLPEPDDEWEQCTIDQIRKGDRVRWQDPGMEDICTYEIIASHTEAEDPGWILFSNTESYYFPPGAVVDRIPAPHPDPKEHAVIIVSGAYDRDWMDSYAYVSDGAEYNIIEPVNSESRLLPEAIHNWKPAKVVEDDR